MPGGRPTLYKPEYVKQAYRLALLGCSQAEMGRIFGVDDETVAEWKRVHPEFSDACARGGDDADAVIAKSLFHRAKGYKHPAVKIFMPQGAPAPVIVPFTQHYPPDTPAALAWLERRQSEKWAKPEPKGDDSAGPIIIYNSPSADASDT